MITKAVCAVLLVMFCGLQYRLWFGANGITQVQRFNARIEQLREGNAELEKQNHALHVQVIDLKSGVGVLESLARSELGMIREGETFYFQPGSR